LASASLSACPDALSRFSTQREHLQNGQDRLGGQAGRSPRPGPAHGRPLRGLLERPQPRSEWFKSGSRAPRPSSRSTGPDHPAYELRQGRPKLLGPEISHRLLISLPSSTLLRPPSGPDRGAPRESF